MALRSLSLCWLFYWILLVCTIRKMPWSDARSAEVANAWVVRASASLYDPKMIQKHNTFSPSRRQETQSSITWKRDFGGIWEWTIQHPKRLGIWQQMQQWQSGRKTSAKARHTVNSCVFLLSHSYGLMFIIFYNVNVAGAALQIPPLTNRLLCPSNQRTKLNDAVQTTANLT